MKKFMVLILSLTMLFIVNCSSSTDNNPTTPSVTITQPVDGDTLFTSTTLIKIEVSADEDIDNVSFSIDDEGIYTDQTQPFECEWSDFYWADGQKHTIEATAYDINNIPGSDNITITVSEDAKRYPTLLEPEDSSEVQNPIEFKWKSLPDAQYYTMKIVKEDDTTFTFIQQTTETLPPAHPDTTLNFSIPDTAGLGHYTWTVQVQNIWTLWSEYSPPFHFILTDE
ncbi:MAG: Ig-like domain-containing protein [Candidatus Cloacimonadota bacterium]|nr:Ig-like domain-containing protein [Candidatus Cloacimonadota bacterium]